MRVELPGGHWAELRDASQLVGGDRRAIKAAIRLTFTPGQTGAQEIGADVQERQQLALLRRLIVSWSLTNYPIPLSEPPDQEDPVLERLPLDIYDALIAAIQPQLDKLDAAGKSSTGSVEDSTGGPSPETPQP